MLLAIILSSDKTEWRLISAILCGWRCCFVADQLWFMTRIQECRDHTPNVFILEQSLSTTSNSYINNRL